MSSANQLKFINSLGKKLCGSWGASLSDIRTRVDELLLLERRLEHHNREERKDRVNAEIPPPIIKIISYVATHYNLTFEDIIGSSRKKRIITARHMAVALAHEHTDYSLPELGDAFGNRDHTTMLNSIKRAVELMTVRSHTIVDWKHLSKLINDNKNINKSLTTHK